ncbi:MAG: type III secretion system chaperone [Pseudomonadota bacterium]
MDNYQTYTDQLVALGEKLELGRIIAHGDTDAWEINVDERLTVAAKMTDAGIVLMATVCDLPRRPDADTLRALLEYSAEWSVAEGRRFAIDPEDGSAMLIGDVSAVEMADGTLGYALYSFIDELRAARAWLERSIAAEAAAGLDEIGHENLIRP